MENNLAVQFIFIVITTVIFVLSVESMGFLTNVVLRRVLRDEVKRTDPNFIVRTFIGSITYTMVLFVLGLVNSISRPSVVVYTILTPVLIALLFKRWRGVRNIYKNTEQNDRYLVVGCLMFLASTLVLWFRPVTNFDGLWYHIVIPKLFLQNGNISDLGPIIRYSVQPTLSYFWNLWPLALPVSTPIASIAINLVATSFVAMGLGYCLRVFGRAWSFGRWHFLALPLLIGSTYEILCSIGTGGNDLLGLAFGLMVTAYIYSLLKGKHISWHSFTVALLLFIGMASVKIFFTIGAIPILAYFLFNSWPKLAGSNSKRLKKMLLISSLVFAATYLPWIVRSYVSTGMPLFPIGAPGFNEGVYWSEGGGTALNHWTKYIFERISDNTVYALFFAYSPLFFAGILSIFNEQIRKRVGSLHLTLVAAFCLSFTSSIALQWRYYLPAVVLLTIFGALALTEVSKKFDAYGKLLIGMICVAFIAVNFLRVVYSEQNNSGFPSINRDLYISNFKGVDNYLNTRLSPKIYDYVQQSQPKDLGESEKIFVGIANVQPNIPIYSLQKLGYLKNPYIEVSTHSVLFKKVKSSEDLRRVLHDQGVRYMLARDRPTEICKIAGVKDSQKCIGLFKPVFYDSKWFVTWYKLQ